MKIRAPLGAFANRNFAPNVAVFYRSISTLVLGEHEAGSVKASSLSAVAAAKLLGENNSISLLLSGSGPSLHEAAAHAASYNPSISRVLLADSDKFAYPLAEAWGALVDTLQRRDNYSHIVAASGSFGKNVLPRAAALLDVSPVTDVTQISGANLFVRPIYAGNALSTVRYVGSNPCMLTIRSTSFPLGPEFSSRGSNSGAIDIVDLSAINEDEVVEKSKYISISSQETERPDLGNSRVVVTGGRGLKSAENFKLIEKLAEKLGAA
ncbi:hypothetical protein M569_05908, partial [Genlisea aurea]